MKRGGYVRLLARPSRDKLQPSLGLSRWTLGDTVNPTVVVLRFWNSLTEEREDL